MPFLLVLVFVLVGTPMVMADEPTPRTVGCLPNYPNDPCPSPTVVVPEPGLGLLLPAGLLLLQRKKRASGV
jgi:hypothetical protein